MSHHLDVRSAFASADSKSARIARDLLAGREIHVVDSTSASMGVGILAELGATVVKIERPGAGDEDDLRR